MTSNRAGYVNGRHFTTYINDVKDLKKQGLLDKAEALLLHILDANEAEANAQNWSSAPAWYHELAKLYRKRKDFGKEVEVLERLRNNAVRTQAVEKARPGGYIDPVEERLEKAKALLAQQVLAPTSRSD